ncbi:MAG TPA: asparaginase [Xanthobacteraceae bacterium]|nr:asparaginase [Xanthobacteraceae bacterium]
MTDNPVLVDVWRGTRVESRHRGAYAVCDADGRLVAAAGDVAVPVFARSAVKALQALPLVASGAADAFGLSPPELALACASHGGEPAHVAAATAILTKAGLDAGALECGAHRPLNVAAADAIVASGARWSALHNNCSGKHAGFLCLACHTGAPTQGYIDPAHAVQREVKAAIEAIAGAAVAQDGCGTDGCSAPTYALPLTGLATAFARFGTGHAMAPATASAAARLRAAVAAHPFMVAGSGRFCTGVMEVLGPRAFVKWGAEGVVCIALPDAGLGIAVKVDDGGTRGVEAASAALLQRHLALSPEEVVSLDAWARPTLTNWNGMVVGRLTPSEPLLGGA